MSFSELANRHVCPRCSGSLLAEYVQLGQALFGQLLVCIHCGAEENNAAIRRSVGLPEHLFGSDRRVAALGLTQRRNLA